MTAPRLDILRRRNTLAGALCLLAGSLSLLMPCSSAHAQLPQAQLFALSPPGGKSGSTVNVKITSSANLEGAKRLVFSHPGITAQQKVSDPTSYGAPGVPLEDQYIVTIGPDVPLGMYDVRVIGRFGISNPRTFTVGDRAEILEPGDNNRLDKAAPIELENVANGSTNAAEVDYYKFSAKRDQRVLLELWAQRIDSKMDGTLVLYDANGRELARCRDTYRYDPLIDFRAPADGEYTVAVFDMLYEGGNDHFYRLLVHTGPHIDLILPPVGEAGKKGKFTVYGRNLPQGQQVKNMAIGKESLERLEVEIAVPADPSAIDTTGYASIPSIRSSLDSFEYRLASPKGSSNPWRLGFAAGPIVTEAEPNDGPQQAQALTVPCQLVGQFNAASDQDWVQFEGHKGVTYWLEMVSARLGITTDPALLVQRVTKDDKGQEKSTDLQESDDRQATGDAVFLTASGDPTVKFTAPENGVYRVMIRDLYSTRYGPQQVYALSVREAAPDFRLVAMASSSPLETKRNDNNNPAPATPWNPLVRRGGTDVLKIIALRRDDFKEEIEITAEGLPAGVICSPVRLGPDQSESVLAFSASQDAAEWSGPIRIIGRSTRGKEKLEREAMGGVTVWPGAQNRVGEARVVQEIMLGVSAIETSPVMVEVDATQPWETSRAGKLEIPVKVQRREDFKEPLTLTAVGLPNKIKAESLTIKPEEKEAKLKLSVAADVVPGVYSYLLRAQTQVSYARDVIGAEAATARQKELEKLAADLANQAKEANETVKTADKLVREAQNEVQKAPEEGKAEAMEKAQKATEHKTQMEAAAKTMAERSKAANEAKNAATRKAAELAKSSAPKNVGVTIVSTVGHVKVVPAPITIAKDEAKHAIKANATLEIPIKIERLGNFADPVDLEIAPPGGLKDISFKATAVPKDKGEGVLIVTTGAAPSAGKHAIVVRAKPKLNNQTLTVETKVTVEVE